MMSMDQSEIPNHHSSSFWKTLLFYIHYFPLKANAKTNSNTTLFRHVLKFCNLLYRSPSFTHFKSNDRLQYSLSPTPFSLAFDVNARCHALDSSTAHIILVHFAQNRENFYLPQYPNFILVN